MLFNPAVSKKNMEDLRILKLRMRLKTNQGPEVAYGKKYDIMYMYNIY